MLMKWRLPLGFILAPVIPSALMVLPGIVATAEWRASWRLIVYIVVVLEIISLIVALPTYFLLRRFWRVGALHCTVSGAAIATLTNVLLLSLPLEGYSAGDPGGDTIINGRYTAHGWMQNLSDLLIMGGFGAGIGLLFWVIALWRRRDAQ
jgi:hypothetical protein